MTTAEPSERDVPDGLLDRLRADPLRAPELVALEAAAQHGPAAAVWAHAERTEGRSGEESADAARRKYARLARVEGAAAGLGGWTTILPDLAALAWLQSRLVFHVAAALGHDPEDPLRPAELLVLWDVFDDAAEAREALDLAGTPIASAYVGGKITRAREGGDDRGLVRTLASLLGRKAGKRAGARLVPGFASIVGARENERETRALADRAIAFYRDL